MEKGRKMKLGRDIVYHHKGVGGEWKEFKF